MLEVVIAGLVTGWAIAIPIGAVGALLVALTARTSMRTGSAAALGVATVDGLYASLAVVGGAAIAAPASARELRPWQAFLAFLALTAVNPTTVVYFAAVVIGNPHLADGWAEGVVFVLAAFVASASWQLTLAVLGSVLGRSVTSRRGRVVTAWVSGLVIAGLAVRTLLG